MDADDEDDGEGDLGVCRIGFEFVHMKIVLHS